MDAGRRDVRRVVRAALVDDLVRIAELVDPVVFLLRVRVDERTRLDDIGDEVLRRLPLPVRDYAHPHPPQLDAPQLDALGLLAVVESLDRDGDDRLIRTAPASGCETPPM
jgi:hypothetical protein